LAGSKLGSVKSAGLVASREAWPELPYSAWKDTLETLHMKLQIVGKVRLALSPFEPQWANVPLYLSARGLTTTPMAFADLIFQIDVDLIDHQVVIQTVRGETRRVALTARPVGDFYADFMSNLGALGIDAGIRPVREDSPETKPDGIDKQVIEPPEAGWNTDLGEFALLYENVRASPSPREAILQFFESTYAAGTRLGGWDPSLLIDGTR
jgi:hypothetical protein